MAITAAVTLPILWLGYGTDLDIGFVLDAGARIRDFDYAPRATRASRWSRRSWPCSTRSAVTSS